MRLHSAQAFRCNEKELKDTEQGGENERKEL